MSVTDFKRSLQQQQPPESYPPALRALWWTSKGQWNAAHDIVMAHGGADCAWVHAHLHRVEGDLDNARYWYRRAGKRVATADLAAEREAIVAALTNGTGT